MVSHECFQQNKLVSKASAYAPFFFILPVPYTRRMPITAGPVGAIRKPGKGKNVFFIKVNGFRCISVCTVGACGAMGCNPEAGCTETLRPERSLGRVIHGHSAIGVFPQPLAVEGLSRGQSGPLNCRARQNSRCCRESLLDKEVEIAGRPVYMIATMFVRPASCCMGHFLCHEETFFELTVFPHPNQNLPTSSTL